jgi:hypothetical protein
MAEQVVHHPPISAIYVENRKHNLTMNAQIYTKSKFLGNSAASINIGELYMYVCNRPGETYVMDFPTAYACGLFLGRLRMELGGKQTIKCEKTGLICEVEFKTKPMFGGDVNKVKGCIRSIKDERQVFYTFEGKWDSVINMKDSRGKESVMLDVEHLPVHKKFVTKLDHQGEWESRRVWHNVVEALKKTDHDLATKHKTELEDAQRARKKERDEKNVQYQTKHFHLVDNRWVFKNIRTTPYDSAKESKEENALPWGGKVDASEEAALSGAIAGLKVGAAPAPSSSSGNAANSGSAKPAGQGSANILGL